MPDEGFLIIGIGGTGTPSPEYGCQMVRTSAAGDPTFTTRFAYSNLSTLESFVSNDPNELIVSGEIEPYPNKTQKSLILRIATTGSVIDSISTPKFQKLVKSPAGYFIRVETNDPTHVRFYKLQLNELFQ